MTLTVATPPGGRPGACGPHHRLDEVFLNQVQVRFLQTRQLRPCVNHLSGPAHPLNQGIEIMKKPV